MLSRFYKNIEEKRVLQLYEQRFSHFAKYPDQARHVSQAYQRGTCLLESKFDLRASFDKEEPR